MFSEIQTKVPYELFLKSENLEGLQGNWKPIG